MAEQQSGEKTEQPTPKRRQDARKKGTVARSTDLVGALGLLASTFIVPVAAVTLTEGAFKAFSNGLARIPGTGEMGDVVRFSLQMGAPLVLGLLPIMATMILVGIVANLVQVGLMATPESIAPKAERINPLAGFKRLFSGRSFVEALKAIFKMFLFGWIAWMAIRERWDVLVNLMNLPAGLAAREVGYLAHTILIRIGIAWLVLAVLDYAYQRWEVEKQLRMTRDELRREMREQEGSPEVKMAQMQRRRRLAKGSLASQVKDADVIVTNPTHFAVALKYERSRMHAPMVVAKGQDLIALRIKELARGAKVPVVENKVLARALYKKCEVGSFVPRDLFAPVAEVLAYVFQSVEKARR